MSKNIEINIKTSSNTYEALYPKFSFSNASDSLDIKNTIGNLDSSRVNKRITCQHGMYYGTGSNSFPLSHTINYSIPIYPLYFHIGSSSGISFNKPVIKNSYLGGLGYGERMWPIIEGNLSFWFNNKEKENTSTSSLFAGQYQSGEWSVKVEIECTTTSTKITFNNNDGTIRPTDIFNDLYVNIFWTILGETVN